MGKEDKMKCLIFNQKKVKEEISQDEIDDFKDMLYEVGYELFDINSDLKDRLFAVIETKLELNRWSRRIYNEFLDLIKPYQKNLTPKTKASYLKWVKFMKKYNSYWGKTQ